MKRNLLILDGHNMLFKAYGIPFKFNSSKGTPLHVVTAFLSLIRRAVSVIEADGGCTEIAIVFDSIEKTSNHALSADYKTNRRDYSQDEDSPFHHAPQVLKVLQSLKIKMYVKRGIEADDVIASLAACYLKTYPRGKVFIASTDSDFYQLLSKNVNIIAFGKGGADGVFGPRNMKEKLGITPKQYVYFKSLTGDTADNIKGVPGIGLVRAAKIVNRKLSFDVRPYKEILEKNKLLITLNQTMKVCKNWKPLALRGPALFSKNPDIFHAVGL